MSVAPELHDLAGVIHVHSLHSDGTGTVAEIAAAAASNGLDYVLLTDHDTLAARQYGEEGRYGAVLVLVGEEVSPYRENHYLAFGIDRPIDHAGLGPREIVARVNDAGGFGFLSHPFSRGSARFRRAAGGMPWRDLEVAGYCGLELWSFVTDSGEKIGGIADVLRFVATPGRFVDHPPRANLETWDRICATRRCVAIGGIDAHQIGVRVGNHVPLRLMAYKRSFRYLRTHVLTEQPPTGDLDRDRQLVFEALQAGHAYIAMDALGSARGFRFWAEGRQAASMGDELPGESVESLHVSLPQPARLRLIRDGHELASVRGTGLEHEVEGAGVYRVEAYREAHGRERTWILSNPIYLR
jgi:hypothetical protein